jgi:hypothetical protein
LAGACFSTAENKGKAKLVFFKLAVSVFIKIGKINEFARRLNYLIEAMEPVFGNAVAVGVNGFYVNGDNTVIFRAVFFR